MIKGIVFDLDGTLLNTLGDLAAACNLALTDFGLVPKPLEAYRLMVGDGTRMLCARASALQGEALDDFLQCYYGHYERRPANSAPYDGIAECLDTLHRLHVRMAVYTNKPQLWSEALIAQYLPDLLSPIVGARPQKPVKPDPWGLHEIAEQWGLRPAEMCMVGDSDVDVLTAHRAQMQCVGAGWGFRGSQELVNAGADFVIAQPLDLLKIEQLPLA